MKATIALTILNEDNSPFFNTSVGYDGLSRADVVELERVLMDTMSKLHSIGAEKAKGKK